MSPRRSALCRRPASTLRWCAQSAPIRPDRIDALARGIGLAPIEPRQYELLPEALSGLKPVLGRKPEARATTAAYRPGVGAATDSAPCHPQTPRIALPAIRAWLMHAAIASVFMLIAGQTVRLPRRHAGTRLSRAEPSTTSSCGPTSSTGAAIWSRQTPTLRCLPIPRSSATRTRRPRGWRHSFPTSIRASCARFCRQGAPVRWIGAAHAYRGATRPRSRHSRSRLPPRPRRVYPTRIPPVTSSQVDVDNRGVSGVERHIDETGADPRPCRRAASRRCSSLSTLVSERDRGDARPRRVSSRRTARLVC